MTIKDKIENVLDKMPGHHGKAQTGTHNAAGRPGDITGSGNDGYSNTGAAGTGYSLGHTGTSTTAASDYRHHVEDPGAMAGGEPGGVTSTGTQGYDTEASKAALSGKGVTTDDHLAHDGNLSVRDHHARGGIVGADRTDQVVDRMGGGIAGDKVYGVEEGAVLGGSGYGTGNRDYDSGTAGTATGTTTGATGLTGAYDDAAYLREGGVDRVPGTPTTAHLHEGRTRAGAGTASGAGLAAGAAGYAAGRSTGAGEYGTASGRDYSSGTTGTGTGMTGTGTSMTGMTGTGTNMTGNGTNMTGSGTGVTSTGTGGATGMTGDATGMYGGGGGVTGDRTSGYGADSTYGTTTGMTDRDTVTGTRTGGIDEREIIDSKTFTKTVDHEVLVEKKRYELEHRPVQEQYVVETRRVGENVLPTRAEYVGNEVKEVDERVVAAPRGDRTVIVQDVDVPLEKVTRGVGNMGLMGREYGATEREV